LASNSRFISIFGEIHCDPKMSCFFISLWFLQTLTDFYNIWHAVYQVNLQLIYVKFV